MWTVVALSLRWALSPGQRAVLVSGRHAGYSRRYLATRIAAIFRVSANGAPSGVMQHSTKPDRRRRLLIGERLSRGTVAKPKAEGRPRVGLTLSPRRRGIARSGRQESTYCGRSRPRPWTPQLGGERAYMGYLGKDRNPGESRCSSASGVGFAGKIEGIPRLASGATSRARARSALQFFSGFREAIADGYS
jgi:hypothetical protein